MEAPGATAAEEELANEPTTKPEAHGRAALLLVESLIHGLAARSVISVAEAVSIIEVALDAQIAITEDALTPSTSMREAAALLLSLKTSLQIDLPVGEA